VFDNSVNNFHGQLERTKLKAENPLAFLTICISQRDINF